MTASQVEGFVELDGVVSRPECLYDALVGALQTGTVDQLRPYTDPTSYKIAEEPEGSLGDEVIFRCRPGCYARCGALVSAHNVYVSGSVADRVAERCDKLL